MTLASTVDGELAERALEIIRSEPGIPAFRLQAALELPEYGLGPVVAYLAAAGLIESCAGHLHPLDQRIAPFTTPYDWVGGNYPPDLLATRAWRIRCADDWYFLAWSATEGWSLHTRRCSGRWFRVWSGDGPEPDPDTYRPARRPPASRLPGIDPRRGDGRPALTTPPALGNPHKRDPLAGIPYDLWIRVLPSLGAF